MQTAWFAIMTLATLAFFVPRATANVYMPLVRGGVKIVQPGPCSCEADTLNCSDFKTQTEAQACFDFCVSQGVGDIHRLDQNNDGVACESLPLNFRIIR